MKFIIVSDHAGRSTKEKAEKALIELGIEYTDYSVENKPTDDYPDFAKEVAEEISKKRNTYGILSCGTGIGMSIAANKIKGIRAALVHSKKEAVLARRDNNANILILPGKYTDFQAKNLKAIIKAFKETKFDKGRHLRRERKILNLEK